jgi:hypothetical protein
VIRADLTRAIRDALSTISHCEGVGCGDANQIGAAEAGLATLYQLDALLAHLLAFVEEQARACPACGGTGVISRPGCADLDCLLPRCRRLRELLEEARR